MLSNRQSLTQLYRLDAVSMGIDRIAEPEDSVARDVPEKLVSCLWFDPRWRPLTFRNSRWPFILCALARSVESAGRSLIFGRR